MTLMLLFVHCVRTKFLRLKDKNEENNTGFVPKKTTRIAKGFNRKWLKLEMLFSGGDEKRWGGPMKSSKTIQPSWAPPRST